MSTNKRLFEKHSFSDRVSTVWSDERVKLLSQILIILLFSCLAAIGKKIHPSMGIPGSSAMFWLGPMVAGKALVRRNGSGVAMGAMIPVWGLSLGLNNGFFYNVGLYSVTGFALDLGSNLPTMNPRTFSGAILAGTFAHLVKFSYIFSYDYVAAITRNPILYGIARSLILHVAFGVGAGIVGWAIWKGSEFAGNSSKKLKE